MTYQWHRPRACGCEKTGRYPDEQTALLAALAVSGKIGGRPTRVYRCPGSSTWHVASRGFHPRSLKSRARIMAWHLTTTRAFTRRSLLRAMDIEPDAGPAKRFFEILGVFAQLGLVSWERGTPRHADAAIKVLDAEGLGRIMSVGLEEYVDARGMKLEHRRKVVPQYQPVASSCAHAPHGEP